MSNYLEKMVEEFKYDLSENNLSFICSKWVLDRVPFVFENDRITFLKWKEELSLKLGIDPMAMVFIGSASCGFSLNPYKNYKEFNDNSDIDIAIISELHFDIAWNTLRNLGTKRLDLNQKQQSSLKDHVERLVYWGTIATDKLLILLPFGKEWIKHLDSMSIKLPVNNRNINIRLYKDFNALRAYQTGNLEKLKMKILEKETR